jgi:hypothetical protein
MMNHEALSVLFVLDTGAIKNLVELSAVWRLRPPVLPVGHLASCYSFDIGSVFHLSFYLSGLIQCAR